MKNLFLKNNNNTMSGVVTPGYMESAKLVIQKNKLLAEIIENQSKMKSMEREIKKLEKQNEHLEKSLKKVEHDMDRCTNLYRKAFVFVLENECSGSAATLFKKYPNEKILVDRYTSLMASEALKVYILHCSKKISSWDDLVSIHNLAVTCKLFYHTMKQTLEPLSITHATSTLQITTIPPHISPCTVHLYPVSKCFSEIQWCYNHLCGSLDYENPVFYIKLWRKRVKILIGYWNIDIQEIPPIPDNIPLPIREQLIADEETNPHYQMFQNEMATMNGTVEKCAELRLLGDTYSLPDEK